MDLRGLDRARLEAREHAALSWVRSFLTCPDGVPCEVEEGFREACAAYEQVGVMAAMKGMFCVNLSVNTVRHVLVRLGMAPAARGESCPLDG